MTIKGCLGESNFIVEKLRRMLTHAMEQKVSTTLRDEGKKPPGVSKLALKNPASYRMSDFIRHVKRMVSKSTGSPTLQRASRMSNQCWEQRRFCLSVQVRAAEREVTACKVAILTLSTYVMPSNIGCVSLSNSQIGR